LNISTDITGTLPVTNGGTGAATLTDHGVLLGQGTDAVVVTAVGTAGDVLTSNGAGSDPTWQAAASGGKVLQVKYTSISTVVDCSVAMPIDNTIPQKTEGTEVLTLAITPASATNYLHIYGTISGGTNNSGSGLAIFQDDTASAIAAFPLALSADGRSMTNWSYHYYMAAGTTSETTFKLRIGTYDAHFYVNGNYSGTRPFGAVTMTNLFIEEISA